MIGRPLYETLYNDLVVQPSEAYRAAIGQPVHLDPTAFDLFLERLKGFRELYPNVTFWQVIDYKTLEITHSDGDRELFGHKFKTFKNVFQHMHPDYVHPYLRWRTAAFELILSQSLKINPLDVAYRFGIPLQTQDNHYYWFTMSSTILQIDAQGKIVSTLQTFFQDMKWSPRNLRPVEASLSIRNPDSQDIENLILTKISLQLIDEFTNAELDLLALYAKNETPKTIMESKKWSRHTLHEYNANILRKARMLFVYDFRNARNFAEYCQEKGYIQFR